MILPHDHQIAAWLAEGPDQGPPEPLARALAATHRTSKRPRWTFPERWLPMQLTMRRPVVPRAFMYLALVGLLLIALAAAVLLLPGSTTIPEPLGATNGFIAYDSGGKIYLADPDGSNPRPLEHPGRAYSPTFSPDGSKLAYLATNDVGQLHVFVADADGSDPVQVSSVPFDSGRNKFPPAWSPDGTMLSHYARDGGVYVMSADGRAQQQIGQGWSTAWSPDGEWIAYRSDGSPDAPLRIVHPDGTGLRTLTTAPADTDSFAQLRWLPDSSRIVYHRGGGGIETIDLQANEVELSPTGGYPDVSPDGRWVSFVEEQDGAELVRLVELATGTVSTLGPGGCAAYFAPDSTAVITFANGCFNDLQIIPLDDPSTPVVVELPGDAGFMGWQAIPAASAATEEE